jgi:polyhydroxyalkanoate synthase
MSQPVDAEAASLARADVAPQQRPRGPHPLPVFLAMAAEAVDGDRDRLAAVLAGVRAYQAHPHARRLPSVPAIARVGNVRLLDYGGGGPPVAFVPSLVNPPTVLDLAADNSLLRWLSGQGVRPLLVDWGTPGPSELELSIDGYVAERLLPLLAGIGAPAAVVGYCLGGTMAIAAAAALRPPKLALIAAPWRFSAYGAERRAMLAQAWAGIAPSAATIGAVPMEMVQPLFWRLDAQGAIAKFERFGRLAADSDEALAFVALEDWANDGPPLSMPAARQCFEDFFGRDAPGAGHWTADPARLDCPILDIVSTRDRIVPAAAAAGVGRRIDIDAGHVGMVVGSRARRLLWEPLRDWLLD